MRIINYIWQASRRKKLIATIYCFQLLLSLTLVLQVYQVLDASIGNSLSLGRMITKFDYTILQDLFNVHGASLSPLIGKLRWYIVVYMIFSAFINAGIWNSLNKDVNQNDWTSFWNGGAKYFSRFLSIGLFMSLLLIVWSAVLWGPYLTSFFNMMETWLKDSHIIWIGIMIFIIWIHGVTYLFVWGSYARIAIVGGQYQGAWRSIISNFKFCSLRYFRILPSLWIFALILFLLYFIVIFLESNIGISSVGLILGFFLIQQLVIWMKIAHRLGVYKFLLEDYQKKR